jgi:hypothetical protein
MKHRTRLYLIMGILFVGICAYIVYSSFVSRSLIPEEKIIFLSADCTEQQGINGLYWSAQIIIKNDGPSDLVVKKVYIDGLEVVSQQSPPNDNEASMSTSKEGGKLSPGETATIRIYIDFGYKNYKTFQRIQVSLETMYQKYSINVVLG